MRVKGIVQGRWKWKGKEGRARREDKKINRGGEYDQSILYACVKISW
jgi:hypothetical protein